MQNQKKTLLMGLHQSGSIFELKRAFSLTGSSTCLKRPQQPHQPHQPHFSNGAKDLILKWAPSPFTTLGGAFCQNFTK